MGQNRVPRRELVPLARTQLKFVAVVCLPLVLSCVVVAFWQTYFFLTSLRATGAMQSELARQIISTSILIGIITLVVMVPVFFAIAVWISYRVVGPMRRLASELASVGAGRIQGEFQFRKGDELTFVAEAVSQMKRGLQERLAACLDALAQLEEAGREVESQVEAGQVEDLKRAIAELRTQMNAFSSEEITSSDK